MCQPNDVNHDMAPSWLFNKVSEAEHQEEQLQPTAMLPVTLPT